MITRSGTEPPLVSQVRVAARKAVRWLANLADSRLCDRDIQGLCLSLFGISCALRLFPAGERPTAEGQRETERLLDRLTGLQRGLRSSFRQSSSVTPLMAAASLMSTSTAAKSFQSVCLREWQVMETKDEVMANPTLLWTGRHLASTITGEIFGSSSIDWMPQATALSKYTAKIDEIPRLAGVLAAMTAFGRIASLSRETEHGPVEQALRFWTFFFVKNRDLDTVCPLLRALAYLGLQSLPEYSEGLSFLVHQGKADGHFGMHEMSIHLQAANAVAALDTEREIYLPLTVAGLWTLATCIPPVPIFCGAESYP
jgi:hypothetical protein